MAPRHHRRVRLLKDDERSRSENTHHRAQRGDRIGLVPEHASSDRSIEYAVLGTDCAKSPAAKVTFVSVAARTRARER